jgi:TRAP-type C4-dicarboxylate transport system substrate-binding protein
MGSHRNMKRGGAWILVVFSLSGLCFLGCDRDEASKAGGSGPPVTLRIGTDEFRGTPTSRMIDEFTRQVEELSEDSVRIEPVYQAAGKKVTAWDQRVARMVVRGELDMGMIPARAWDTEDVTSLRALQAPFLVTDDALLDEVTGSPLADQMLAGLDEVGVVGIGLLPEELRHPVGFGQPLRSPGDFAGARIRAPLSEVTYDLLRALGAEPVDLPTEEPDLVEGFESGLSRTGPIRKLGGIFTANVVLFAKAQTLVVNAEKFDSLSDGQQDALRKAARRTRAYARETRPSNAELATQACAGGARVVAASEPQLAALEEAAEPIYATLERDETTRSLIERIRAMKREIAVSAPAAPCAAAERRAAGPGDPSVLNGVWRSNPSYEEGVAAGLSESVAADEMGLHTIRMEDGRYSWRWRAKNGDKYCPGEYEVRGARVTFTDGMECGSSSWEAEYRLLDGELRWRAVRSHQGDPEDQLVRELLHSEAWKKIG